MGFDPLASVILGVTLFDETIAETPIGIVVTVLSLAAALTGVAIFLVPRARRRRNRSPDPRRRLRLLLRLETRHRSGTPRSCFCSGPCP